MTDNSDNKKVFGMSEEQWREFQFIEHQLGVTDTKANTIITIDGVLIVISTLTSLFQKEIEQPVRIISTLATASILVSVGFCVRVSWTRWSTQFIGKSHSLEQLKRFRDTKTHYLHVALIILVTSLGLYLSALLIAMTDLLEEESTFPMNEISSFDRSLKQQVGNTDVSRVLPFLHNQSKIVQDVNLCFSPPGKDFAEPFCDFYMATIYEVCQAIPDELYVCESPAVNDFIKSRSIVDGQTDKMAQTFKLHYNEIEQTAPKK